jgi:hypothetical protein
MKRSTTTALLGLLGLLTAAAAGWGLLALAFAWQFDETLRRDLVAAFAVISIGTLVAFFFRPWRWPALAVFASAFGVLLHQYLALEPANDRKWQLDVAVLPHATIEGDLVKVHNIRNFDYRSETEFTPAYYDRTFDLRTLEGVDLVAAYWMGPAIAHTFLSFSFAGGDHLAVSIETRKESHEAYSTLRGFFRQYEIYYVVADERDVIRLRTNYRRSPPEDVYVYRVQGALDNGRRVFLEYMKQINSLANSPRFYNTLTSNCTVDIWYNTLINAEHLPFSWKILASGYLPEYLYEAARLDSSVSFAELRQRSHVNGRARAADSAMDFSRRIRQGPEEPPSQGGMPGRPAATQLQQHAHDARDGHSPAPASSPPPR